MREQVVCLKENTGVMQHSLSHERTQATQPRHQIKPYFRHPQPGITKAVLWIVIDFFVINSVKKYCKIPHKQVRFNGKLQEMIITMITTITCTFNEWSFFLFTYTSGFFIGALIAMRVPSTKPMTFGIPLASCTRVWYLLSALSFV